MTRYDNRPLLAAIRAKIADLNAGDQLELFSIEND